MFPDHHTTAARAADAYLRQLREERQWRQALEDAKPKPWQYRPNEQRRPRR